MIQEFLERAKRSLRLVRQHQHLRNVADEVAVIRECLATASSSPISIGVTDADLIEMVRNGYLAEARVIFELACDKAASSIEKDFYFSEIVALIVKATVASRPSESPVRAASLLAEPTTEHDAADPLAENKRLTAERKRLKAELASVDDRLATLRAEQDERNAALLAKFDPSNGNEVFKALSQLPGQGGDVEDLDFDGAFAAGPEALSAPILPAVFALVIDDSAVSPPNNDSEPAIELTTADIVEERDEGPDPVIEIVADDISDEELCALRFFGEKDAVALGLLYPLVNVSPRKRTIPPLPPRRRRATSDHA